MKKYWKLLTLLVAGLLLVAGADAAMAQTESPSEADWYVRYWNNMDQVGQPVLERNEIDVDHDWGLGSPGSAVNPDNFSAQWTSPVFFEEGTYRFTLSSDDGARVWLDSHGYIIDSWTERTIEETDVAIVDLEEGVHDIAVDYFEDGGFAAISFDWQRVGDEDQDTDDETNVTIDPNRGPVGTEVFVRATGFTPGSDVTVGIGRAASETTTSFETQIPADGTLETSITVPEGADVGEPWRVLVLGEGAERALSTDFIVTADGDAGACGPTYVVQPNDWLYKIARNCNTTVDAILALNPGIQTPNSIPVGLTLEMPVGEDDETQPNVTITPQSGPPGTTIMADITGFAPNEEISVAVREPGELPQTGMPVNTNDEGNVQVNVLLPDEVQPGQTWHVLVRSDEQNAESQPFTVTSGADETVMVTPRYNLNLRSGPGTDFEDLDTVPAGTTLEVFERSPDGNWVRVQYNDTNGWIAAWLADVSGTLESVPLSSDE